MSRRPPRLPITDRWQTRKGMRRALRAYLRGVYGVTSTRSCLHGDRPTKRREIGRFVRRERREAAALEARAIALTIACAEPPIVPVRVTVARPGSCFGAAWLLAGVSQGIEPVVSRTYTRRIGWT